MTFFGKKLVAQPSLTLLRPKYHNFISDTLAGLGRAEVNDNDRTTDTVLQRHTFKKLHGDKRLTIVLPDFINSADIWMVQCRGRLSFSLKSGQRLRFFCQFIRQKLQGDKPPQS